MVVTSLKFSQLEKPQRFLDEGRSTVRQRTAYVTLFDKSLGIRKAIVLDRGKFVHLCASVEFVKVGVSSSNEL